MSCSARLWQRYWSSAAKNCFAASFPLFDGPERLLLRPDSQRLHFAVKIAALQAQQLRRPRHVAVGFLEFFEDVLALDGFADLLQTAESLRPLGCGAARGLQRNVARIHTRLRVQNDDALNQVAQLAHVAWPVMLL